MKNSRIFRGGIILLSLALIVGVFSAIALADNNGTNGMYGMRGRSSGDIETPRYGMQNKGNSFQEQNQNCEDCAGYLNSEMNTGMGNRENAPDNDGDGIPNGQDSDYIQHDCDEECDGTCDSTPKGNGWRRYSSENEQTAEISIHLSGRELKEMKIFDFAKFWGIDANLLLSELVEEFNLAKDYNIDNTIEDLRGEFRFSPFQVKDLAEKIKIE